MKKFIPFLVFPGAFASVGMYNDKSNVATCYGEDP